MSLRYIMYLRKSSESEERQELSIQGQDRELTELATKRGFLIIYKFEEARSAKEPGRPIFGQMIKLLLASRADGVIVWKLDRLARNPKDGGDLIYELGKKRIKAIVTPERTYTGTADDKMLMSINFGIATKYSDDLSDNVKRGNRDALEHGRWPGKAKLGYQRDSVTKKLIPDRERFTIIQELWRKFLSGTKPLELLSLARDTYQLTTPEWGKCGGKLISKSHLYRMLRDPFYAGLMVRGGETYSGTHMAVVTLAQFEGAQELLDGKVRPLTKPKHLSFTYGGLIRCGVCNGTVTAKYTINRYGTKYIHYYCCRKEKRYFYCPEGVLREEELEAQLKKLLETCTPPRYWTSKLMQCLEKLEKSQSETTEKSNEIRKDRIAILERQLERLRELLLKGILSEEEYLSDRERLIIEKQKLTEQGSKAKHTEQLVEPYGDAVSLLSAAPHLFTNARSEEKRALIKTVTWNLILKDKKVSIVAKKPFSYIGEWSKFPSWSG